MEQSFYEGGVRVKDTLNENRTDYRERKSGPIVASTGTFSATNSSPTEDSVYSTPRSTAHERKSRYAYVTPIAQRFEIADPPPDFSKYEIEEDWEQDTTGKYKERSSQNSIVESSEASSGDSDDEFVYKSKGKRRLKRRGKPTKIPREEYKYVQGAIANYAHDAITKLAARPRRRSVLEDTYSSDEADKIVFKRNKERNIHIPFSKAQEERVDSPDGEEPVEKMDRMDRSMSSTK